MKNILIACLFLLLLSGCSAKKHYKPEKIDSEIGYSKTLKSKLADVARDGATYKNGQVITKYHGLLEVSIPEGFRLVNASEDALIITSGRGEMQILSNAGNLIYKKSFPEQLASASISSNLLAMVFADNTIMLYDVKEDRMIYKEPLARAVALDARLANPIFLNDLVVFATLDGRLLIMDSTKKVVLRDVAISDKELFNNVMFLQVIGNNLIAATSSKVIAIDPKAINHFDLDVRDILYEKNRIYVFTKSGHIVLLNEKLEKQKEIKFEYALFSAVFANEKLYAVEKRGYLLEIEKDLSSFKVVQMPDPIESSLFAYDKKIYFDNYFIDVK